MSELQQSNCRVVCLLSPLYAYRYDKFMYEPGTSSAVVVFSRLLRPQTILHAWNVVASVGVRTDRDAAQWTTHCLNAWSWWKTIHVINLWNITACIMQQVRR